MQTMPESQLQLNLLKITGCRQLYRLGGQLPVPLYRPKLKIKVIIGVTNTIDPQQTACSLSTVT